MTTQLLSGIVEKKLEVILDGVVECDELYLIAGLQRPTNQSETNARIG